MIKHILSPIEARVIGCFLEKQVTTPEQYPLSLNALTTACNQKTNREPVLDLSESEVQNALDLLVRKHQIRSINAPGSRVVKYEHRFCNSEFGDLRFSPAEVALICCLLLRGPQTPGELRTRSNRLYAFADVNEAEQALNRLAEREDGPFVVRLAREPGRRESRYAHLFCGEAAIGAESAAVDTASAAVETDELSARVTALESEVADLKRRLASLLSDE
ncbi:YceH family protein [Edwardsiella tarda]|uniref:YceH family protein n=1 Tax=Edwardsiella tarda TaxID=636 RepID=UPI00030FE57B|nr:YceH family protein [Edwardsiella tarda]STD29784.1 G20.3 [Edwardsiella tarda]